MMMMRIIIIIIMRVRSDMIAGLSEIPRFEWGQHSCHNGRPLCTHTCIITDPSDTGLDAATSRISYSLPVAIPIIK